MTRQFKEGAYKEPQHIAIIKDTLVAFGYGKLDARKLAYDIRQNLDNYLAIQDAYSKRRVSENPTAFRPTQTSRRPNAYV